MPGDNQLKGYLSETDKKKFTISVGILGAVCLILQFILPFVFMIVFMFGSAFTTMSNFENFEPDRAVTWDDQIWFLSSSEGISSKDLNSTKLYTLEEGSDDPYLVLEIAAKEPWLLADRDKLWIISSSYLGYLSGDELIELSLDTTLGVISHPFLYGGQPAVIEFLPDGVTLKVLQDNNWKKRAAFDLWTTEQADFIVKNVRVLIDKGTMHLFYKGRSMIYYKNNPIDSRTFDAVNWNPIVESDGSWFAYLSSQGPEIFYSNHLRKKIIGARLEDGKFDEFFDFESFGVSDIGVCGLGNGDNFMLLYSSYPGSIRIVEVSGNEIVRDFRFGKDFPFSRGMMFMMFMPQALSLLIPFLLAFIITALMRKHRIPEYRVQDRQVKYAPLISRALAQLIDSVIVGLPIGIGWFMAMAPVFDMDKFANPSEFFMLSSFGVMGLGILWAIGGLFLFSHLEGKFGITPGKKIMGIKVIGVELEPCGFGRALIRNLLKVIDGFFSFMVGVLIIALSDNWQRVGDMAARTIVIDVRKKTN